MSQYFKYGNQGLPGFGDSTFGAVAKGKRTATTRFPIWYGGEKSQGWKSVEEIAPGEYIQFTDSKSVTPSTQSIVTRVKETPLGTWYAERGQGKGGSYPLTTEQIRNNPQYRERWSELEGWTQKAGIDFFSKEPRGYGRQIQYEIPKEYAFIGARDLSQFEPNVIGAFQKAAENAARAGYLIVTGAAKGADQLAAESALKAGGAVRLSLPWSGYEKEWVSDLSNRNPGRVAIDTRIPVRGFDDAASQSIDQYHPSPGSLKGSVHSLHARNYNILSAPQGNVAGVIALAPKVDGTVQGGTGQGARIAGGLGIPLSVFDSPESIPSRFL
jgi:hypothetical protein